MYDVGKQKRALHGNGIYSTPDVEYAANIYSKTFQVEGKKYKIVLQNRVNPSALKIPEVDKRIFLVADGTHIRPYGILIRKCN